MRVLQHQVHTHGGTLLQVRCDEKGYLAICAWGLPGRTHKVGGVHLSEFIQLAYSSKAPGLVSTPVSLKREKNWGASQFACFSNGSTCVPLQSG
jgi:hypothetical protein